ncbi:MAG TPA: choice-of-anchor Q domain-containing protein [Kiritimatiellia bacterium]|nr:choice-of-anchor Q domain-containing protein [Kiritimatiellia bacterium]HRZ12596.1 choice-of-anchor Q domain-containing protein [Kiritimatiellia bacterium]HSA17674.1 choice-of-anchor Q domain-containing protein [Kiritimatiellia bacterium]
MFAVGASAQTTRYVVPVNPGAAAPYTNWVTAATNVQDAVSAATAGDTVWVSNGTYYLGSPLEITKGVTARSVNGFEATVLDAQYPVRTNRCLYMNHPAGVVDGFTVRGGHAPGDYFDFPGNCGGGVFFNNGGCVRRCRITGNSATRDGGGVFFYDGSAGGVLEHCEIISNSAQWVGGVCMGAVTGIVRNCVIAYNTASSRAGAARIGEGQMCHCTVVLNNAGDRAGGIEGSGLIVNSILYFNTAVSDNNYSEGPVFETSCTTPDPGAGTGNITNDPVFVDAAAGDFRLTTNSPCVDAGSPTNQLAGDINGIPRPLDGNNDGTNAWDMGAHEFVHPEADSDADWLRDGDEILAGTDPLDPLSLLEVSRLRFQASAPAVSWSSVNGKTYALSRSTNLPAGAWTPVQSGIAGAAPMNTVTDATAVGNGPWHYRIELE